MSKFSGKCDFYDSFVSIHGDDDEAKVMENLEKLNLYVYGKDGRKHRVKSDTIKDIAKYYPYLETVMCSSKEGYMTVILASDSFIDQEENQHLDWYIQSVFKYWRKCKRNKKEFIIDECFKSSYWIRGEILQIIAERVAKNGDKANFDDIHLPMHEHYRRQWFEELVRVGYTEREAYDWCFKGFLTDEQTIVKRLGRALNDGKNRSD